MNSSFDSGWTRGPILLPLLLCLHCGSSQPGASSPPGSAGAPANAAAGSMNIPGSSGAAGAAGSDSQSFGGAVASIPGAPGCGLGDKAAFCESFDAPSTSRSRAGELDPLKWSGARNQPQFPSSNGLSIGVSAASIPKCRAGLLDRVFPNGDTVVCDPDPRIASNHLLVAVGAQNYGQNSYRVRQPFDFEGRTGKIVFDAEGFNDQLLGWVSLEVSEDPIPGPSFATLGVPNDEGSVVPRNAFEVQFQTKCPGIVTGPAVGLRMLVVYDNYVGNFMMPAKQVCPTAKQGSLNHFELTVSKSKIDVFASDYSPDGATFATPQLIYSAAVNLPFTRGYVNISTHNHATIKYSENNSLDAWIARWDNVGFDGPVISKFREYDVPDAQVMGMAEGSTVPVMNIGYRVADVASGPSSKLHFSSVNLSGATSAKMALSAWYLKSDKTAQYVLQYRFNGKAWRSRALSAAEAAIIDGESQGQVGQMLDVSLADLVDGDNSVEFVTSVAPQNYAPVIANVGLILTL
jgi:hypothetical protein